MTFWINSLIFWSCHLLKFSCSVTFFWSLVFSSLDIFSKLLTNEPKLSTISRRANLLKSALSVVVPNLLSSIIPILPSFSHQFDTHFKRLLGLSLVRDQIIDLAYSICSVSSFISSAWF